MLPTSRRNKSRRCWCAATANFIQKVRLPGKGAIHRALVFTSLEIQSCSVCCAHDIQKHIVRTAHATLTTRRRSGEVKLPPSLKIVGWTRCTHRLLNYRVGTKSCPPYRTTLGEFDFEICILHPSIPQGERANGLISRSQCRVHSMHHGAHSAPYKDTNHFLVFVKNTVTSSRS